MKHPRNDGPPVASPQDAIATLTPRETDVLEWMTAGKSNGEIALILGTSVNTVRNQVQRILAKLGVENRTAAALIASQVATSLHGR